MAELEAKKSATEETLKPKGGVTAFLPADYLKSAFLGITGIFRNDKNQLNIRAINALLFCLTGILTLYYIHFLTVSLNKINTIDLKKFVHRQSGAAVLPKDNPVLKPLAFYLEGVKKRDIFRMGQRVLSDSPEVISVKAAETAKTLKLVGISWSDTPDAMIEDTKINKTYFVKKGQLVGELKVEAIYKDKVVLRLGAETFELR